MIPFYIVNGIKGLPEKSHLDFFKQKRLTPELAFINIILSACFYLNGYEQLRIPLIRINYCTSKREKQFSYLLISLPPYGWNITNQTNFFLLTMYHNIKHLLKPPLQPAFHRLSHNKVLLRNPYFHTFLVQKWPFFRPFSAVFSWFFRSWNKVLP